MNTKENKPQSGGVLVSQQVMPNLSREIIKNCSDDKLTWGEIENLLGEKITDVVMYDLNAKKINRDTYNGYYVIGEKQISKMASEIQTLCSGGVALGGRVPAAVFAKTYDCDYTNTFTDRVFFRVPPFDNTGKCIAGNIIFYNNQTKKYEGLPRGWFYAGGRACRGSASEDSLLAVFKTLSLDFLKQQRWKTK